MARGSGRAPGRPKADPAAEAARQAAFLGQQGGEPAEPVAAEPAPAVPVAEPAAVPPVEPAPAEPTPVTPAPAQPVEPAAVMAAPPAMAPGVQTLSPVAPDPAAVTLALPELDATGTPTAVRDLYVVPAGCLDPAFDPHRPPAATTVLVTDPGQIAASGAWMPLPGGTRIATTREVQRVYWAMGAVSPSYAIVVSAGTAMPRPVELGAAVAPAAPSAGAA